MHRGVRGCSGRAAAAPPREEMGWPPDSEVKPHPALDTDDLFLSFNTKSPTNPLTRGVPEEAARLSPALTVSCS